MLLLNRPLHFIWVNCCLIQIRCEPWLFHSSTFLRSTRYYWSVWQGMMNERQATTSLFPKLCWICVKDDFTQHGPDVYVCRWAAGIRTADDPSLLCSLWSSTLWCGGLHCVGAPKAARRNLRQHLYLTVGAATGFSICTIMQNKFFVSFSFLFQCIQS